MPVVDAIAAARSDGFLEEQCTPTNFRLILFLYGTGFFEIDRICHQQGSIRGDKRGAQTRNSQGTQERNHGIPKG